MLSDVKKIDDFYRGFWRRNFYKILIILCKKTINRRELWDKYGFY